jgi:glycosyltransferase involved in cell wall biosynthesis
MYCGGCLRDNALVTELRRAGHDVTMVPLYLPLTLDESNQSAGTPIFFGGINVYLDQKSALFRRCPRWLHRLLAAPGLLKWAGGRAAKTRPDDLGDLTLSMLRGEEGKQARELDELIAWLKTQDRPDAVLLSNSLLAGMLRRLRDELKCPVVCMLQGEDWFLDSLPESHRAACWTEVAARVGEADGIVAPSRYFADLMARRLRLDPNAINVVYNGINLDGFPSAQNARPGTSETQPVLGYFARMCREKGLDLLVEAYIKLRRGGSKRPLKLKVGGSYGPSDEPFVEELRGRLQAAGVLRDVEFHPNLDRAAKVSFYESLSVFSVPATYGEAFGLYVIEALAAGVPVVQPCSGAFPELIGETGGGLLCEPSDSQSLADVITELLEAPDYARELGRRGQNCVARRFTAAEMAAGIVNVCRSAAGSRLRR